MFQEDGARFIRDFFEGCTNDVIYLFKRSGTITWLESCPRFGYHSLPYFSNMLYSRIVCIYIVNEQEYNRGCLGVEIVIDRDVDLDIGLR